MGRGRLSPGMRHAMASAGWLASGQQYEGLARWPKRIAAVTEADVQQFARAVAKPGRVVVGQYLPVKP